MIKYISNIIKKISRKKIDQRTLNNLSYYKTNFSALDNIERGLYNNTLKIMLDSAKTDAMILNSTTNIDLFLDHWNHLVSTLSILSDHEFTGFFSNTLPSDNLRNILENKYLTEINFFKRTYAKDESGKYIIPEIDKIKISAFSHSSMYFLETGEEPGIPT